MGKLKKIMPILLAATILAACGTNEQAEEAPVEQQEETLDVAAETAQFQAYAVSQMSDFVQDAQLLASLINEGKLEEAQKLYPLVTMYFERIRPIMAAYPELAAALYGPLEQGKENEGTGFARLAYGLFEEKKTAGYEDVAKKLVEDIVALQNKLQDEREIDVNPLASALTMLDEMEKARLTASSNSNAEVYAVKAQTEGLEQLVNIFKGRSSEQSAAAATEAISALNDVVSYYEVGKEDYVNYSFFTSKQKEELIAAVSNVNVALGQMNDSLK